MTSKPAETKKPFFSCCSAEEQKKQIYIDLEDKKQPPLSFSPPRTPSSNQSLFLSPLSHIMLSPQTKHLKLDSPTQLQQKKIKFIHRLLHPLSNIDRVTSDPISLFIIKSHSFERLCVKKRIHFFINRLLFGNGNFGRVQQFNCKEAQIFE